MREEWIRLCIQLAKTEATYWASGKKIIRNVQYRFTEFGDDDAMTIEEIGYTNLKLGLLRGLYLHEESLLSAVDQWNNRRNYKPVAHWSVGFSCYNHVLKPHSKGATEGSFSSTMGPCLQAITITHTPRGVAEVDVFYRTTEITKKFPADLVLIREHMLNRFDFERTPLAGMTIHAANVTVSPTYIGTLLSVVSDPVGVMEEIRGGDPAFHRIACRWIYNMLSGPESKFNQARRTQRSVKRLMADKDQEAMLEYSGKWRTK